MAQFEEGPGRLWTIAERPTGRDGVVDMVFRLRAETRVAYGVPVGPLDYDRVSAAFNASAPMIAGGVMLAAPAPTSTVNEF